MKESPKIRQLAGLILSLIAFIPRLSAQGTAFTYQGFLTSQGAPANGAVDLQFSVFDAVSGGAQQGVTVQSNAFNITNGLFTVSIDPGANVFTGGARWLNIGVRPAGSASFTNVVPRQPITAAPYAIYAGGVSAAGISGTIPASALSGTYSGVVNLSNVNNSFAGNGAGLTNLNSWRLDGNGGTVAGVNYVGTSDNQPIEFKVNGARALRLEPGTFAPNVIGGDAANSVLPGVTGATISGGGSLLGVGHQIDANYGTIAGGQANSIAADASSAAIAGGFSNTIERDAASALIGGGALNVVRSNCVAATIGGGYANVIDPGTALLMSGYQTTIAGGLENFASGSASFIGAGNRNSIQAGGAVIAGGSENTNYLGHYSVIGGGFHNFVGNLFAVVPGGQSNSAYGENSFAAGRNAWASFDGNFVWNSYPVRNVAIGPNQFSVFAQHGFNVDYSTQRGDGGGSRWVYIGDNFAGDTIRAWNGAHLTDGGAWANASDRNLKTDFAETDVRQLLEKLVSLPIRGWRYTNEAAGVQHLGPTAQDFKAAFGLGTDEKSIATVDADGVALAAIQGLNQKLEETRAENAELKRELAEIKRLLLKR